MSVAVAPSTSCSLAMPLDARSRATDATSTDPWGPSRALMEDVRADTLTRNCADVLHVLHEALLSSGSQWRRALKALTTIAHCLRKGSREIGLFVLGNRSLITQLCQFEFLDAYGLDRGAAVREEACAIADMLQLSTSPPSDAGPSTLKAPIHSRPEPAPPPPTQMILFPISKVEDNLRPPPIQEDAFSETEHLAHLIKHIESSSDDELTWLNIYKLLFLVYNALPTASNSDIRHWKQHVHLLARLARRQAAPLPNSISPEVKRLAGELAVLFEGGARPSEVRQRATMF